MRRRPHQTRLFGALAIALLLVVDFGGKLHEALVPHAICAEHGESVELSARAPASASSASETRDPRVVDASKSLGARHEHCEVALLGRTKELLDTRHSPAILPASAPQDCVESTTTSTERSVPLLLLAPKHSPPAIA